MSDEEQGEGTPQMIAQYKDGQLQIVEVTPFKGIKEETHILPDLTNSNDLTKYAVLEPNNGLMKLNLLNLKLVRCPNGEEQYQFVTNVEGEVTEGEVTDEATVTCVLQSSDNEDPDNQESYVMVEGESEQGPLVFLQSSLQLANQEKKTEEKEKILLSPSEILEKAKALQKAKSLISQSSRSRNTRKRKSDLPPPHELLALPNFKLYLYSCKHCNFKCNAIRDMSTHKASEHGAGSRARGPWRGPAATTLQCARCPYRGNTHSQLMKHVHDKHVSAKANTVHLDTEEVEAADVLVCGACGFESSSRPDFRKHIEEEHGATTC